MLSTDVIAQLVDDRELVLRFFFLFSRFEYTLKRTGYLKKKHKAEADWDAYCNQLRGMFANLNDLRFT